MKNQKQLIDLVRKTLKKFSLYVDDQTVEPWWLDKDCISITVQERPAGQRSVVGVLKREDDIWKVYKGLELVYGGEFLTAAISELVTLYFKREVYGFVNFTLNS